MSGKMMLVKAISKMKVGDKFVIHESLDPYYRSLTMAEDEKGTYFYSEGCTCVALRPEFLALTGEILPAEPVVLTVEEIKKDFILHAPHTIECGCINMPIDCLNVLIKISQENGRLERDKELRQLHEKTIKLIEIFHGSEMTNTADLCHEISEILSDIPPLTPEPK